MRDLYLVSGDPTVPGGAWLAGKYRDFSESMTTRAHPFAELGNRTPVGRYDIFGDAAKAEQLRNFFAGLGLSADIDQVDRWSNLPASVLLALAMMVFFSVVVVGATVLSEVKAYGVGRLHGLSHGRLLLADLGAGAATWAMTGAMVAAGVLACQ